MQCNNQVTQCSGFSSRASSVDIPGICVVDVCVVGISVVDTVIPCVLFFTSLQTTVNSPAIDVVNDRIAHTNDSHVSYCFK